MVRGPVPHVLCSVRRAWPLSALGLLALAACSSGPEPRPAQPPPPPPPPRPAENIPPPPPPPLLSLPVTRSVDTPRLPRATVVDLSRRLSDQIGGSGRFSIASTSTESAEPCLTEGCELGQAERAGARSLLHTRLVQYAEKCVLLGALYDVGSKRNQWAHAKSFPCDGASADAAISELGAAFLTRSDAEPQGAVHAVAPVQHDLTDLAWASESWAEYMSTIFMMNGKMVVPASTVVAPLAGKKEPHKACGTPKCAVDLAKNAGAEQILTTRIKKKKNECSVEAALLVAATKKGGANASAKGGCAAADLVESFRAVAEKLSGATAAEPPPAEAPPAEAPPAEAPPAEAPPEEPTDDLR